MAVKIAPRCSVGEISGRGGGSSFSPLFSLSVKAISLQRSKACASLQACSLSGGTESLLTGAHCPQKHFLGSQEERAALMSPADKARQQPKPADQ